MRVETDRMYLYPVSKKEEKQLAKQMVQCYYNHEKNKLEVNFMDSCDGYGRSRKHGAFSCKHDTAVCGK